MSAEEKSAEGEALSRGRPAERPPLLSAASHSLAAQRLLLDCLLDTVSLKAGSHCSYHGPRDLENKWNLGENMENSRMLFPSFRPGKMHPFLKTLRSLALLFLSYVAVIMSFYASLKL